MGYTHSIENIKNTEWQDLCRQRNKLKEKVLTLIQLLQSNKRWIDVSIQCTE